MDNKGSTLLENVISIFLLAIFALMVASSVVSGVKALDRANKENRRLYEVYTAIEQEHYTGLEQDSTGKLAYAFQGEHYGIGGTQYYDKEKKILGEFIRTP